MPEPEGGTRYTGCGTGGDIPRGIAAAAAPAPLPSFWAWRCVRFAWAWACAWAGARGGASGAAPSYRIRIRFMHFSSVFHRSLGLSSICDGSGAAPAVLLFETVVVRVVVREREAVVASLALLVATSFFLRQL